MTSLVKVRSSEIETAATIFSFKRLFRQEINDKCFYMNEMMSSLLFFEASNKYKSPICLFYDDGHGGMYENALKIDRQHTKTQFSVSLCN